MGDVEPFPVAGDVYIKQSSVNFFVEKIFEGRYRTFDPRGVRKEMWRSNEPFAMHFLLIMLCSVFSARLTFTG